MKTGLLLFVLTMMTSFANADGYDKEAFTTDAQTAIKAFATELKSELMNAMTTQGPVAAIDVCHQVAPQIAANLSTKCNLEIGRTSLKNRNANNQPDNWEQSVLTSFEQRLAAGEPVESLSFVEQVNSESGVKWRLMKAIPTGQVCLTCHGEDIAEPVQAQLNKLYPADKATGFKLGDIRGAFTVSEPL